MECFSDNINTSYKNAICIDMDGPINCHTKSSKSVKQILYSNTYMWNLEKQYRWTYLQSKNRNTDIENKCMDPGEERRDGISWEIDIDIYILLILCINWITNGNLLYFTGSSLQSSVVAWRGRKSRRGDLYMYSWFTLLYSRNQYNIVK